MDQSIPRLGGADAPLRGRAIPVVLSGFFGGTARGELVTTNLSVAADPHTVWNRIALYEEVKRQPPLLLRIFMPHPMRTEGEKTQAGQIVHCVYDGGDLVKRIIAVEPPHRMAFDVIEQRLGIEGCVIAQEGAYQVNRVPGGSEVVLTTQYRTFLHPRWLWRPLERMVAKSLHLHILHALQEGGHESALSSALIITQEKSAPSIAAESAGDASGRGDGAGSKVPRVPTGVEGNSLRDV